MNPEIVSIGSLGVFTAGVFLASGSVNDPEKEYHLEFCSPEEKIAEELISLLGEIGVNAGITVRRGQYIVYIKGSESIEDTLTFINAQQCTLELMNVKIYKDVRNKANRITNCDNANINKVVKASMKQVEDIKLIAEKRGLESLTDELRQVAEIRLESIGLSLQDIGESLEPPISRSGVNHRFKKLAKIADEIRNSGG
jgi:DNA-binding protein WhiA